MNKTEFINKVKQGLDNMPKDEQENALRYYVEYFQDAGEDNEEEVIKELGTPEEVVAKIKSEIGENINTTPKKKTEPWMIVLLVLASPFILTGLAVVASLLLALFAVVFAIGITGSALIFTGLVITVISFFAIPTSVATFIFMLGAGISSFAIGSFILIGTYSLIKGLGTLTASLVEKMKGWFK